MSSPRLIGGIDDNGNLVAIAVNSDGSIKMGGTSLGRKITFNKVSADYALTLDDDFLAVDCSSTAVNITLPSAVTSSNIVYPIQSFVYEIKKIDTTSNHVVVLTVDSQTIDGISNFTLITPHQAISLISDGSNWLIF
ncbi:MAG: hypothetical protein V7L23_29935 [Nostoc sp.]|uniref:hypothetical protein n=1 Tax=Nostoc sp. TaxID=1180 RepID=UPI002FF2672E